MKEKLLESIGKQAANLQTSVAIMNENVKKIKNAEVKDIYIARRDAVIAYAAALQAIVDANK